MNKALIAKVGWRLLHDKVCLWARVVRNKYKLRLNQDQTWGGVKGNWSSTWRSVAIGLADVISEGQSWVIGDGRSVQFWQSKWLNGKQILASPSQVIPDAQKNLLVNEFWITGTGWDRSKIQPYVSENTWLDLLAVVVDEVTGAPDRISWGERSDGRFSVKSAYDLLTHDEIPRQRMGSFFNRIWRVVAPERVRTFLWLVGNQALMTNHERYRRHLCDSEICQVCKSGSETIIHILRDCQAMSGIWTRIVPPRRRENFFSLTLLEWVYTNLGQISGETESTWPTLFAMAAWWAWKWRCGNLWGENRICRDRVQFIKDISHEVLMANSKLMSQGRRVERVERLIKWEVPTIGWLKLNTDGASQGNPGRAAAGGVLRNRNGEWCGGFAVNLGRGSAPLAELWGVYYGLYMAWERGTKFLEVEVDSEMVVGFLKTGINDSHPLSFLVRLCHGFLLKDWSVRLSHVYREANRLADGLANYALSLPLGFCNFDVVPLAVESIVRDDVEGPARPRQVPG